MQVAIDTNAYSFFASGEKKTVQVFQSATEIFIPVPVLAELRYGFIKGEKQTQNERFLTKFLDSPRVQTLHCDEQTTHFYAQLKLQLVKQGTPISTNDVWIAALVIQHGLKLYTFDQDFAHLPQLSRVG